MKIIRLLLLLSLFHLLFSCQTEMVTYKSFEDYPTYAGSDLGLRYSPERAIFKIWSPPASKARVKLYERGVGGTPLVTQLMKKGQSSTWTAIFEEDLAGKFYAFQVFIGGKWLNEVPDPYAKAVGLNGKRGMVADLQKTNPEDWEEDVRPPLKNFTDIILYELHLRDISVQPASGIEHKGKFVGLTERGTTNPAGLSTGLDHIKELGVTHVHLLPSFDFKSIDEAHLSENKFNWGYDPQNYNTPEGSYSTDPAVGTVRIREFKQLVKTLHANGLRVILDVVYNHTGDTEGSNFNQLVPGYYYRQDAEGGFSNATGCGNETASERPMMRKFIVESVRYWAEEYHLDGFRFDLMGVHDIETMNAVSEALHKIDPTIFIYGEGWTAGASPLPEELRAVKKNTFKLNGVAAFSDDMRDAIKGHVFTPDAKAFINGLPGLEESVKFGVVASTQHPQIDYEKVNYSKTPWANEPSQTINYVSCHDNHTLWDRLLNSCKGEPESELIKMDKLANTIVLTSQGVPFLQAGVEFLRTKAGVENSFNSPDSINRIDWTRKSMYRDVFEYYRKLIQLRKNHPAFRMPSQELIVKNLQFLDIRENNLLGFVLKNHANGDSFKNILVFYNGNEAGKMVPVPEGNWMVICRDGKIEESGMGEMKGAKRVKISGRSALILVQK